MELDEVLRRRRMVRNYDPTRTVAPEVLDHILINATRAPSAGNTQGWAFVVCEGVGQVEAFWRVATPPASPPTRWLQGMRRAPVVIVALSSAAAYTQRYAEADKARAADAAWPVAYWHLDTGFAALLMLLSAVDAGLGACFFGIPAGQVGPLCAAFGVPASHSPVGAITLGYAAPDHRPASLRRGRRPLGEVVHRGHW